jgi:hypothetical protein
LASSFCLVVDVLLKRKRKRTRLRGRSSAKAARSGNGLRVALTFAVMA